MTNKLLKQVKENLIDNETRCVHYHSPLDVIAIKFKCCNAYYPCYSCHKEAAGHDAVVWPKNEFDQKAILCGVCGEELSIHQYLSGGDACIFCQAPFNPGCKNHHPYYFE